MPATLPGRCTLSSIPHDNPQPSDSPASSTGGLLDRCPPPEVFASHLEIRRIPSVALLSLLTVVLLGISFAPFDCGPVAYVALVPYVLAMGGATRGRWSLLIGWACGAMFWAGILYWLTLPTVVGYIGSVVYLSLYWVVQSSLVRRAMRRGWPMWIVLPVLWVGIEYLRSHVIGFEWFFLAQSQYRRLRLIQIADVTGQYGVSFFVAMINGALVDLLTSPLFVRFRGRVRLALHISCGVSACVLVSLGLLVYGSWRLGQKTLSPGPTVGVVQEAIPISLEGQIYRSEQTMGFHLQSTLRFIGEECDVILWPETMLPQGINREVLYANPRDMSEPELRSLVARMLSPRYAKAYKLSQLRQFVILQVGEYPIGAYRGPAVRHLLHEYILPAQLDRLSPEVLRTLNFHAYGIEVGADVPLPLLQEALLAWLGGVEPAGQRLSEEACRLVARWNWPDASRGSDIAAIRQNLSRYVQRRLAGDEEMLASLRCQAVMMDIASLMVDCPILAGATTIHRNVRSTGPEDLWVYRNSALWFTPAGQLETVYSKINLVPFSEAVPLKYTWRTGHEALRWFVPDVMPQLDPGRERTRFPLHTGEGRYELAAPICFEGTFAAVGRQMARAGRKDRLILANLSNDGWFVYRDGRDLFRGTTEQAQHLVHSVFRAVENRVPVVRAVNTGISAIIEPTGRIAEVLERSSGNRRQRTMVAGRLRGRVLVDSRRTLYTAIGDVFAWLVVAAGVLLAGMLWRRTHGKRRESCP